MIETSNTHSRDGTGLHPHHPYTKTEKVGKDARGPWVGKQGLGGINPFFFLDEKVSRHLRVNRRKE